MTSVSMNPFQSLQQLDAKSARLDSEANNALAFGLSACSVMCLGAALHIILGVVFPSPATPILFGVGCAYAGAALGFLVGGIGAFCYKKYQKKINAQ